MKKISLVLAMVLLAGFSAFAGLSGNASIIFPILGMSVGARPQGMGEAYTAIADDASAVYWNAAGLSQVKRPVIGLSYDNWLTDVFFGQVQFAYPLAVGTIGAELIYLNGGELQGFDDFANPTGAYSFFNLGGSVAYGLDLGGNFSAGIAVKVITMSTGPASRTAFAADLGGQYKHGTISAGLNVQNIGASTASGYDMPKNIKAGLAVKALDTKVHELTAALDVQYNLGDAVALGAGVEYFYDKTLGARLGYKVPFAENNIEGFRGLTAGIGIRYGNISFDYALMPYGELGFTQKGTLSYAFGSPARPASKSADIKPAEPSYSETTGTTAEAKPAAKKPAEKKQAAAAAVNKAAASKPAAKRNAIYEAALALEKQGEIDKALAKYREALSADAKIAAAWRRLGGLYLQKNNKADAIKCYEEYLKLNPKDKEMADWLKAYKKAK